MTCRCLRPFFSVLAGLPALNSLLETSVESVFEGRQALRKLHRGSSVPSLPLALFVRQALCLP